MAIGTLMRVDFESDECIPGDMMLFIATPQGGVVGGEVFWCMKDDAESMRDRIAEIEEAAQPV